MRLQVFSSTGRRLTGRGLEIRNRVTPMVYGDMGEEEPETPQPLPVVGGPDSVDRTSHGVDPETPPIFGADYAVVTPVLSQRLHNVAVSAAPEMVEQGALTENLVEQWERRRLQLQIASVYWYCGIEKSQILDIMRDANAPLNLEETLAFKCLVRCFPVAEGLHPAEHIPVMGALEAAWGAGSLPRILGVLSHSLL